MDRVGARLFGRTDVLLRVQVRGDLDGLVGRSRVQGAVIVGSDDRDGGDSLFAAGTKDAQRDLAAVRYQELPYRHSAASVSAHSALSTRYGIASRVASASAAPPADPATCA